MNPAYVVNQDYKDYVDSWVGTDSDLTKRLARAEHYVDLLAAPRGIVQPATNTLHRAGITGLPTGGFFVLTLPYNGQSYVSGNIAFNASAVSVAVALAPFPLSLRVVGGPLPLSPVYVGFSNNEAIPPGSVSSSLTGDPAATVAWDMSAQGGAFGKRFDLATLRMADILAVKNAVCAQTEYMVANQDDLFIKAQYSQVRGPDFTTAGRLPVVAPKARRELALAGLGFGTARSKP